MSGREPKPHPEMLVRLMLEHGDGPGALRFCALWRAREPDAPALAELEQAAARLGEATGRAPLSPALAERFLQQGYVAEALEVYRGLEAAGALEQDAAARREVLEEFVRFELPAEAAPEQVAAEEHVAGRRLPSALLDYRELARCRPTDPVVVGRTEQLRAIVLGIPGAVGEPSEELRRTAPMPLALRARLMTKAGNLVEAALTFKVMAAKQDPGPHVVELARALDRLSELAGRARLERSTDEHGTVRLGPEGFAGFHVRVGNYAVAAELYRGLVERRPDDEGLRSRLDDLRVVLDYLRREEGASTPPPERRKKRRYSETRDFGLPRAAPPNPERALGKRSGSYELGAFRVPGKEHESGSHQLAEDPTKRVDKREMAEVQLARGFIDQAMLLLEELLDERPRDEELRARVQDLRERFGVRVSGGDDSTSTLMSPPAVPVADKDESRPPIDPAAMVVALRAAPNEDETARTAASWLPTQRVPPLGRPGLDEVPTAVRRRSARTQPSLPPTIEEVRGSSIVEVPAGISAIVERTPGRLDAAEAAEAAEPLGVTVRPVLLIE